MAEDKGIGITILGIVAVIAVVGLIILLSGGRFTGKTATNFYDRNLYGAANRYSGGLFPGRAQQVAVTPQNPITPQGLNPEVCIGMRKVSIATGMNTPGCVDAGNDMDYCCPFGIEQITGDIPLTQSDCFRLAKAYDYTVLVTLNRVEAQPRSTTTLNPCTGNSESGTERVLDANEPQRDYARVQFSNGDSWGVIGGLQAGNVQYALCAGFKARVRVSGVDVCNTIG